MPEEKTKITVVKGVEGFSLIINDYRTCGPKPWGGGEIICEFDVDETELKKALDT